MSCKKRLSPSWEQIRWAFPGSRFWWRPSCSSRSEHPASRVLQKIKRRNVWKDKRNKNEVTSCAAVPGESAVCRRGHNPHTVSVIQELVLWEQICWQEQQEGNDRMFNVLHVRLVNQNYHPHWDIQHFRTPTTFWQIVVMEGGLARIRPLILVDMRVFGTCVKNFSRPQM